MAHSRQKRTYAVLTAVLALAALGNTLAATTFATPYVTRAEAAAILILTRVKTVANATANGRFADVKAGSWYEKYVVMAERYGILKADASGKMYPEAPVTRAVFLKMLSTTFGLQEGMGHLYKDVPLGVWYEKYAGIAERYKLFPDQGGRHELRPGSYVTHREASLAVQTITLAREKGNSMPIDRQTVQKQAELKLQLYLIISTQQEHVTLVNTGKHARRAVSSAPTRAELSESMERLHEMKKEVIRLVNVERAKRGLPPLQYNPTLEGSAQIYAEDMAEDGFFGHVSPEGETLEQRMEQSGFFERFYDRGCICTEHYTLGENLARGQKTPDEVMKAWMNSPSHRDAILNPEFTDIGIGIYAGIWVQHFGGIHRE